MLSWLQYRWTSLWLMFMALGAIITFMYGFFPLKYHSGKLAHFDDLPNFIDEVSIDGHSVYDSGENSVVLMVIDGLRYDFATAEYMPYLGELLKKKTGCIYVAVAEPPTVTMPRIKSPERKVEKAQWRRTINFWRDIFAMMTGSVSTFADVALNFGAPAVKGDSVLRVANARGRRSILYGDDTWLRLFPGLWAEYDGTTSFYVTDYTEVDNNVTRHLDKLLKVDDNNKTKFDFLVLHYLGLDHIGHLEGARSQKIKPKLLEMDQVVKKIFEAMQTWNRKGVLFICGDHGMRDAGGHGGATPAEVLVPLVVVKSSDFTCPHPAGPGPTAAQVDLAPTIAWLLNAPPPGDSAGRILPSLLPTDMRQHLYLLHVIASHNAMQGVPTDLEFFKQFQRAEKQFSHFLATGEQSAAKIAKEFYEESLGEMAKYLTESTVEFDMYSIVMAIVLLYFIVTALTCVTLYSMEPENQRKNFPRHNHRASTAGSVVAFIIILIIIIIVLTISCYITETKSKVCSFDPIWATAFTLIGCAFTTTYFIIKSGIERITDLSTLRRLNAIDYLLILGTLFHPWSFLGTSFIEEEHMTWYFLWNTLVVFVLIKAAVLVYKYKTKHMENLTELEEKPEVLNRIASVFGIIPVLLVLIGIHRYFRSMNQTGDRWLFLPDTADYLNASENAFILHTLLVFGTLLTGIICYTNLTYTNNFKHIHSILTAVSVAAIICYRISTSALPSPLEEITLWDPVSIVNVFWGCIISQFVIEILSFAGIFKSGAITELKKMSTNAFDYYTPKEKVEDYLESVAHEPWNIDDVKLSLARSLLQLMLNSMMLIEVLLMRPHNLVMVPGVYVTSGFMTMCINHKTLNTKLPKAPASQTGVVDVLSKTLMHIWIGVVFFFYQGNSNSLASVDLAAGYVGLRAYCAARVALRMGLHAYAGPALAGALLFRHLALKARTWQQYLKETSQAVNILAAHRVYCLVTYCVIAMIFRHHLFVWTVFSPKLLYDFVAVLFTIQSLATIANVELLTHATSWLARYASYKRRLCYK